MKLFTSGIPYDSTTTELAKQLGLSYAPTVTVAQDEPIEQMTVERLKQIAAWCDPGPDYTGPLCIDTEGKLWYDARGYATNDEPIGIGPWMDKAETKLIRFNNLGEKVWPKAISGFYAPFHISNDNNAVQQDNMIAGMTDRLIVTSRALFPCLYLVSATDFEANKWYIRHALQIYLDMSLVRGGKRVYGYVSYRNFRGDPNHAVIDPEMFRATCEFALTVTDRHGHGKTLDGLILWDAGPETLQKEPWRFGPNPPTSDQLNATHRQYLNVFAETGKVN